ncbi:hypothetical protein ACI2J9_04610 [Pseudomonas fulva]|uniref:hypothetical protein n=1 Tax=Pseudomonas fulva TaxID=47880 RepID=UPI00384B800A
MKFTDDNGLGIGLDSGGIAKVTKGQMVLRNTEMGSEYADYLNGNLRATLWVEVVDSWEKDGNWGGYLKIASAHLKGQYLDCKRGWVRPYSSKYDPVTFIDKGDYYEIWHKTPETGRPLSIEGGVLRFMDDKTNIGQWNIKD